jgi:hypothetical protein
MLQKKGKCLPSYHHILDEALGNFGDTCALRLGIAWVHIQWVGLVTQAMAQVPIWPVLEPLHLITAAKVHFAYQTGAITMSGKMTRPCQMLWKYNPMIRPGGAAMCF